METILTLGILGFVIVSLILGLAASVAMIKAPYRKSPGPAPERHGDTRGTAESGPNPTCPAGVRRVGPEAQ